MIQLALVPAWMTLAIPPVAIVSVKYDHVKCLNRILIGSFLGNSTSSQLPIFSCSWIGGVDGVTRERCR